MKAEHTFAMIKSHIPDPVKRFLRPLIRRTVAERSFPNQGARPKMLSVEPTSAARKIPGDGPTYKGARYVHAGIHERPPTCKMADSILDAGLVDMLRFSVDGATKESYRRNSIGGKLFCAAEY